MTGSYKGNFAETTYDGEGEKNHASSGDVGSETNVGHKKTKRIGKDPTPQPLLVANGWKKNVFAEDGNKTKDETGRPRSRAKKKADRVRRKKTGEGETKWPVPTFSIEGTGLKTEERGNAEEEKPHDDENSQRESFPRNSFHWRKERKKKTARSLGCTTTKKKAPHSQKKTPH